MRVIVAGATGWTNEFSIRRELANLSPGTVVVHGDSPGADEIGGRIPHEFGLPVEAMAKNNEDRQKHGRLAWKGLNERMLATGASRILAFHADIRSSKGTRHLIELAKELRIEVSLFTG